jgi:hypothetical protein
VTAAEKLARQIKRVAELRGTMLAGTRDPAGTTVVLLDSMLERACIAVGRADDGRMEAIGLELEAVDP